MNALLRERADALTKAGAKTALQQLRQAIQESQKKGANDDVAWGLVHTAMVLRGQRKLTTLVKLLVEAQSIFEQTGNPFGLACVQHELSLGNRELGRNALALEYAKKASALFQSLGRTLELGWSHSNLALIYF